MPLDSTGYLSPTSYGERDILFHRPTATEQEQANSEQSVRARRAVDEDGEVLLGAIDLIKKFGHNASSTAVGPNGEVCIGCAIARSARRIDRSGGWDHAMKLAPRLGFGDVNEMFRWNVTATASAVIARLRSAAEQRT